MSSSQLPLGRITESYVPFGVVLCGVGLEMGNHRFVAAVVTLSSLIDHVSGLAACITVFSVKTVKLLEVISDFTCCPQHPEIPSHMYSLSLHNKGVWLEPSFLIYFLYPLSTLC